MTKLLSLIAIASFLTIVTPANAYKVEVLYKLCKPYTDSGFVLERIGDGACYGYIRGVVDYSVQACINLKNRDKLAATLLGSAAGPDNIDAIAQMFVNEAKGKPEEWEYNATAMVTNAAKTIAPCK